MYGEDNIKMTFREIFYDSVDCVLLAKNRDQWFFVVKMLMNIHVP
jgi:hypothetical protein